MNLPLWTEPLDLDAAMLTINNLGRNLHEHAFIIGRNLLWAKKILPHGEFLPWLECNVWFSERTARHMMEFAKRCTKKNRLLSYVTAKTAITADLTEPITFSGKYHTIVIDPPWAYGNNSGRQKMDYSERTMTPAEVAKFDLQRWIPEDFCHLYLWVTDAYLGESYPIVRAWGFEPKASLVWLKDRIGMGNYYRHQHETCIFAVKGKKRLKRLDLSTVFRAPVTKHSEKPDAFYSIVEAASYGPYLDIFGRKLRAGWDVYGDEVAQGYQTRLTGSNHSAIIS